MVDAVVFTANKCLEGLPGLAFAVARVDRLIECHGRAGSWSLDLADIYQHALCGLAGAASASRRRRRRSWPSAPRWTCMRPRAARRGWHAIRRICACSIAASVDFGIAAPMLAGSGAGTDRRQRPRSRPSGLVAAGLCRRREAARLPHQQFLQHPSSHRSGSAASAPSRRRICRRPSNAMGNSLAAMGVTLARAA